MGVPSDWGNYGKRMDVHVKVKLNEDANTGRQFFLRGTRLWRVQNGRTRKDLRAGTHQHAPARPIYKGEGVSYRWDTEF